MRTARHWTVPLQRSTAFSEKQKRPGAMRRAFVAGLVGAI
jgi:hypothetical protein